MSQAESGPSGPSSRANGGSASQSLTAGGHKKKKNRSHKKKRQNRRQSFAAPSESTVQEEDDTDVPDRRPSLLDGPQAGTAPAGLYRLQSGNRSNTSLESESLLDHRDSMPFRARRRSNSNNMFNARSSVTQLRSQARQRPSTPGTGSRLNQVSSNLQVMEDEEDREDNDRTPLLSASQKARPSTSRTGTGFGSTYGSPRVGQGKTGRSPESRKRAIKGYNDPDEHSDDYDVNNPPSMPGSPKLGSLDDVMIAEEFSHGRGTQNDDVVINIDGDATESNTPRSIPQTPRRRSQHDAAQMDVCYPGDTGMSEAGDDDFAHQDSRRSPRRRRRRQWPDLSVLDDWSREEKEERDAEQVRAKKMTEPVMVGGRLRNARQNWHKQEAEAPYRYTYFNENFDATIHSRTIGELCHLGATFSELFRPDPPELNDSSSSEDEEDGFASPAHPPAGLGDRGRASIASLRAEKSRSQTPVNRQQMGNGTGKESQPPTPFKPKRYGPRPTFWLDVLSPTEAEMKVLAKAFGIHQLTVEDIMVQEPREKVELFQNYYFVNYRSFEQDRDSPDYMEPINIYVVVFRDGVLSFHFSMTPHPANVRRRIRQLNDYMSPSSDWISYAIIDDVTDAYAPLVQQVEDDVDDIDDRILALHDAPLNPPAEKKDNKSINEKGSDSQSIKTMEAEEGGKMLRRIGECRKTVMSMYRLLGNKADVIKGFAKRCTEQWQVAPRSEIGLYLGDIQDHIVTMTGNLSHYENLLSRAHSNYLAQVNIRTSERAEQTNDVLNKLTVLGTIVLPLNLVTGLWGCNFWVPGQGKEDDLTWFFGLISAMFLFAVVCYITAKKVFKIV